MLFIKKCDLIGKLRVKSEEHCIYKIKEILILPLAPPGSQFEETESLASIECDIISLNNLNNPTQAASTNTNLINLSSTTSLIDIDNSNSNGSGNNTNSTNNNNNLSSPNLSAQRNISSTNLSESGSSRTQLLTNSPINLANSKFEKKILEEIVKIFQDNQGSFYFSYTYDLTNSVERREERLESDKNATQTSASGLLHFWRHADDRFFWNKILISNLMNAGICNVSLNENGGGNSVDFSELEEKAAIEYRDLIQDKFILPVIQGFAQIECYDNKLPTLVDLNSSEKTSTIQVTAKNSIELKLSLISRRSRYRLGTC